MTKGIGPYALCQFKRKRPLGDKQRRAAFKCVVDHQYRSSREKGGSGPHG